MNSDKMEKFEFLIGDWDLESRIPKSIFSDPGTDTGVGSFKKILKNNYLQFEYSNKSGVAAKGIFAWDEKIKMYRYWWFENSGSFSNATCNFINDKTIAMNWHDTLFVQTFVQESQDRVVLKMKYPDQNGGYELVLEVNLIRRKPGA